MPLDTSAKNRNFIDSKNSVILRQQNNKQKLSQLKPQTQQYEASASDLIQLNLLLARVAFSKNIFEISLNCLREK